MLTAEATTPAVENPVKIRKPIFGEDPSVFTDFYQEETNIVVWRRTLEPRIIEAANNLLRERPTLQISMTVSPENAAEVLHNYLRDERYKDLSSNIAELVDMYCCLFELERVALRLTALASAMCPRFHVDRVPCRLITTYSGVATEWLEHDVVNREKLGRGSCGVPDAQSGLYGSADNIQQLHCGDVALLKGEKWYNNENAGIVHRSPAVDSGKNRLLLTFDFSA